MSKFKGVGLVKLFVIYKMINYKYKTITFNYTQNYLSIKSEYTINSQYFRYGGEKNAYQSNTK